MGKAVCILVLNCLYTVTSVTMKLHLNPRCCSMIWASIFTFQRQSTTAFDGKMKLPVWSNTRLGQAIERRRFVEILPCRCWEAVMRSVPQFASWGEGQPDGQCGRCFPRLWLCSCLRVPDTMPSKACFANSAILLSLLLVTCPGPVEASQHGPGWCDLRHHWMCTHVVLFFKILWKVACKDVEKWACKDVEKWDEKWKLNALKWKHMASASYMQTL